MLAAVAVEVAAFAAAVVVAAVHEDIAAVVVVVLEWETHYEEASNRLQIGDQRWFGRMALHQESYFEKASNQPSLIVVAVAAVEAVVL